MMYRPISPLPPIVPPYCEPSRYHPPLNTLPSLGRWAYHHTRRVYDVLNGGSNRLGSLEGLYNVDGYTIAVLPPLPPEKKTGRFGRPGIVKRSLSRVFLVTIENGQETLTPIGRVGQRFAAIEKRANI